MKEEMDEQNIYRQWHQSFVGTKLGRIVLQGGALKTGYMK